MRGKQNRDWAFIMFICDNCGLFVMIFVSSFCDYDLCVIILLLGLWAFINVFLG